MSDPRIELEHGLSGRYELQRELGRGGMAVVYLARDLRHHRSVALKVIRPELAEAAFAPERFTREIRLAAGLQHPHILPVFDSGETEGQLWYTMPFVAGESVRDRLRREGPLPVADAVRIAREAAQALAHAHRRGVIHRDIKPENLLLGEDGGTLVADFGIARALPTTTTTTTTTTADGGVAEPHPTLTGTGFAVGTPAYMAPEQLLGAPADARGDVYALAATLYELLTGELARQSGGGLELFFQQMSDPTPRVRLRRPEVPEELEAVIRQGLAPNPAERWPSMAAFAEALAAAPLAALPRRSARPRRLALIGGLALAFAGGVGWGWHHLHAGSGRAPAAAGAGADETTKPGAPLRIAVLPFENVGDTANAYLADGMADELTTMLAHLPGLQVAARSSVARFRDRAAPAQTVARALNVGAVLEGTVRRTGDRLRISAQLTNGRDGMILWADQFERPVTDVFALQDEIASAITGALHERIGPGGAPGASPGTADLEAYDQYLKGRFAWSKRGRRGLTEAIRHFEAAVARDPAFARGYTGLAMAYVVLPIFDAAMPGDTALARAERYAGRALALDSTLSDAHLALAYVLKSRWRFPEAERHFRNALALAPDDPAVRHWYGVQLYAVGRIHESVEQLTRARALDPFNATIATDGAVALYGAGRFAEAVAQTRAALALDSTLPDARFVTGIAQLALGHPDSALEAFATAQRFGMGMDMRGYRSAALRRLGRTHEADAVEAELRRAAASDGSAAHQLALAAAAHGDAPTALAAVERTIDQRPMFVTELTLPCEPILASLERQPRFRAALARGGLAVCDRAAPASHEPSGLP